MQPYGLVSLFAMRFKANLHLHMIMYVSFLWIDRYPPREYAHVSISCVDMRR